MSDHMHPAWNKRENDDDDKNINHQAAKNLRKNEQEIHEEWNEKMKYTDNVEAKWITSLARVDGECF